MKNKNFPDHSYHPGFMILHGFEEMMTFQMGSLLEPWKTDPLISGTLRNSSMDKSKYLEHITKDGCN